MKRNLTHVFALCFMAVFALMAVFSSCSSDNEDDLFDDVCDTENVSYAETIAPLMAIHCNSCHGGEFPSANIITENWEGLKIIADDGSLVGSVNHEEGYKAMPQNQPQLDECPRLQIAAWADDGAPEN